ncbi:hypothetical protein KAJ27_16050 [bacterium]|nr:hypothetical protein [bacterium]
MKTKYIFLIMVFLAVTIYCPVAYAFDLDTDDDDLLNEGFSVEQSVYEKHHGTKITLGEKDPFFPLVVKPKRPKRPDKPPRVPPVAGRTPAVPQIPPVELKVICIIGNSGRRMALIKYNGKVKEYWKGDSEPGAFKIVEITNRAVVIYSMRKHRQRSFDLPK